MLALLLLLFFADWVSLFDGKSLNGWMWSTEANPPGPAWAGENGTIHTTPGSGKPVYLLTRDSFRDFDLEFEWKMEPGGNSGIKYRFQGYWVDGQLRDTPSGPGRIEPVALEYQVIDDAKHPDALAIGSIRLRQSMSTGRLNSSIRRNPISGIEAASLLMACTSNTGWMATKLSTSGWTRPKCRLRSRRAEGRAPHPPLQSMSGVSHPLHSSFTTAKYGFETCAFAV